MRKIGILGGTAWLSTIEYYANICQLSERFHRAGGVKPPLPTPEIAIESLSLAKAISLIGTDGDECSWRAFDEYHAQALRRLAAAGAEFALIASNTPHHRFDQITTGLPIPVLNLFSTVAEHCRKHNVSEVLILGTPLTMRSPIILDMFRQYGIRAFAPALQSVKDSVANLIENLQAGARANIAEQLHELATKELQDACAQNAAVCLACTELPLAFDGLTQEGVFEWHGTTYINTTAIHSRAAVDYALGRFQIHEPGTDQSGK